MKYGGLLRLAHRLPVIESRSLVAFGARPETHAVQLSRWVKAGKLIQLRRGFYLLPKELRQVDPPREYLANILVRPSYVSLERALAFHGLIPETVHLLGSVTTARPVSFSTAVGEFSYRHLKNELFFGYRETQVAHGSALMALPEKALLDLVYLHKGRVTRLWIEALRLQNFDLIDPSRLGLLSRRFERARMLDAVALLLDHIDAESAAEVVL
jgi:predicted transcriptional regulator of viral defense system